MQQLFFRRQFGLRLRRNLADQDITRTDISPDADDAVFVKVTKCFFADVRNIASELFASQLRFANFHVELFNVQRRVGIHLHQLFADNDGIFQSYTHRTT